jgi:hypothetical protein
MLAAGVGVAAGRATPSWPGPVAAPAVLAQDGDEDQGEDEDENEGEDRSGPPDCPSWNPRCEFSQHEDGANPPDRPGGGPSGGGVCTFDNGSGHLTVADGSGGTVEFVLVAQAGEVVIPCHHPEHGFYADGCFWRISPPLLLLPKEPPAGADEADGAYYLGTCIAQVIGELPNQDYLMQAAMFFRWFENGEIPVVTPEQVARDWLAGVTLYGVGFQLAPPETGSGLVTLPVWLGVTETETTWGPIADQHCIGGVCISLTALVTAVDWAMGDGASLTCSREQHVAWQPGMNYLQPGDNCHHYYHRASRDQPGGKYQITATSTWTVDWQGTGDAGQLTTTRGATVALEIDEVQVLTR